MHQEIDTSVTTTGVNWQLDWVCPRCQNGLSHSERFDSDYCKKCNVWIEMTCDDPGCGFCSKRPDHPVVRS